VRVGPASPPVVGAHPLTGWKPIPPKPVASRAVVIDGDLGSIPVPIRDLNAGLFAPYLVAGYLKK
jgi:hypothetical protein